MVIHDTGQVIEGKTIRLEDDSVIDVAILKSDISVNLVMHNSLALQRHSNAHHVLEASRLVRRTLLFSQVTAMPVVPLYNNNGRHDRTRSIGEHTVDRLPCAAFDSRGHTAHPR